MRGVRADWDCVPSTDYGGDTGHGDRRAQKDETAQAEDKFCHDDL